MTKFLGAILWCRKSNCLLNMINQTHLLFWRIRKERKVKLSTNFWALKKCSKLSLYARKPIYSLKLRLSKSASEKKNKHAKHFLKWQKTPRRLTTKSQMRFNLRVITNLRKSYSIKWSGISVPKVRTTKMTNSSAKNLWKNPSKRLKCWIICWEI